MITNIAVLLGNCINAAWSWFNDIVVATGTGGILVAAISGCLAIRFIVMPLVGAGTGDLVNEMRGSGRGSRGSGRNRSR